MSTTNNAVLQAIGNNAQPQALADNLVAGPAATQGTAVRLPGNMNRCLKAAATGSFILPSIGTGEANDTVWVINDTAVTINVYPAAGEKMVSVANAAFAVTAGNSAVFVPVVNCVDNYPSTLSWCAGLVTG